MPPATTWEEIKDALPMMRTMHPRNPKYAEELKQTIYDMYTSVPLEYLFADNAPDLCIGL